MPYIAQDDLRPPKQKMIQPPIPTVLRLRNLLWMIFILAFCPSMPVSHPFCCLSNSSAIRALCLSLTKTCEAGKKWRKFIFLLYLALISERSCWDSFSKTAEESKESGPIVPGQIYVFPPTPNILYMQYSFPSFSFFSCSPAVWQFLLPAHFHLTGFTCSLKIYSNTDSFSYSSYSRQQW